MRKEDIYQIEELLNEEEELKCKKLMKDLDDAIATCNREKVEEIMKKLGVYAKIIHQIRIIKMDYDESDIPEQYRGISDVIGFNEFQSLIDYINGGVIYLPRKKTLVKKNRLRYTYNLLVYNGYDYRKTANELGLSDKHIRTHVEQYKRMTKKN